MKTKIFNKAIENEKYQALPPGCSEAFIYRQAMPCQQEAYTTDEVPTDIQEALSLVLLNAADVKGIIFHDVDRRLFMMALMKSYEHKGIVGLWTDNILPPFSKYVDLAQTRLTNILTSKLTEKIAKTQAELKNVEGMARKAIEVGSVPYI